MPSELMEQAKTHLEFLGYTISPMKGETKMLEATRWGRYPFSFYASDYVLNFTAFFATNRGDELGLLQFINSLNLNSRFLRFCKNESTLVCQAFFYGVYTKMNFGLFYETWEQDLDTPLRERRAEFKKYVG